MLYFIESFCVCVVNLFMLIMGYFMCLNNKRNIRKPLDLIIQVVVISLGLYILKVAVGSIGFSLKGLVRCLIPSNYFVILYMVVYFISPTINLFMMKLNQKGAFRVLIVFILLFSVWPTAVDVMAELKGEQWIGLSTIGMYGSQWGYTIINFMLMYFIGAFIRLFNVRIPKRNCLILLSVLTILLVLWAYCNDYIGFFTERSAWEYCNPLVILMAVLWFEIFVQFEIRYNKIINRLAKASFMVFLLHSIFIEQLQIERFSAMALWAVLLHLVLSIVGIYIVCWIAYEIYNHTVQKWLEMMFKKIPIIEKNIYESCFEDI